MPTGYTADVADGKVTDFATFALRCARAFGATIMQHDDDMHDMPKHREESDYYATSLATARAELDALNRMTPADVVAAYEARYQGRVESAQRYAAQRAEQQRRYEAMLADVNAWEPPTAQHVNLKQFMVDQLTESIRFDCAPGYDDTPEREDPKAWYDAELKRVHERVSRAAANLEDERARVAGANAWIDALYASLGVEAQP